MPDDTTPDYGPELTELQRPVRQGSGAVWELGHRLDRAVAIAWQLQRERDEARAEMDKAHRLISLGSQEFAVVTRERDGARADAERYTGWLAAANVELNQAGRTVDRMRPVVEAARALAAVEANRTDASDNCSMWLSAHSDAVGAVLAAVERYEHPVAPDVPASPLSAPVEPVQGETATEGWS